MEIWFNYARPDPPLRHLRRCRSTCCSATPARCRWPTPPSGRSAATRRLPRADLRVELRGRRRCSGMVSPSSSARWSSLPALKLSPEYLILLTLAVSSVIIGIFTTFSELGGTYGLISLPKPTSSAGRWRTPQRLGHPVARRHAPRVRLLPPARRVGLRPGAEGIREDPLATQAMGKNVFALQGGRLRHHVGAGRIRGCVPRRLVPAGHPRRVRLLVLARRCSPSSSSAGWPT